MTLRQLGERPTKREEIDDLLERLEGKKPCWVSETMKEAAELIRELLSGAE